MDETQKSQTGKITYRKILFICSKNKDIYIHTPGQWLGGSTRETPWVLTMFYFLTWVMITWIYSFWKKVYMQVAHLWLLLFCLHVIIQSEEFLLKRIFTFYLKELCLARGKYRTLYFSMIEITKVWSIWLVYQQA